MKNALLLGSYGQSNLGDELMLSIFINFLKSRKYNVYVNSSSPKETALKYSVNTFSTKFFDNLFEKIKACLVCDIYIFGGGNVLVEYPKDYSSNYISRLRSLMLSFLVTLVGRLLSKEVIFAAVGAGPVDSVLGRFLLKLIVKLANEIIVRDVLSYKLIKNITGRRVKLSTDVVLKKELVKSELKNKVVIFPNWYIPLNKSEKYKFSNSIVSFINKLNEEKNEILMIPLWRLYGEYNDEWYSKELIRLGAKARIKRIKNYDDLSEELKSTKFALCMKLHGAIITSIHQISFVAINHNPKMKGFVNEINKSYLLNIPEVTESTLLNKFHNNRFSKKELKKLINLKKQSEITFDILSKYL